MSASGPARRVSVLRKRFSTRSAYRLELRLADGDIVNSFTEPDEFRAALQVLSQSTRFQIFRLISTHPGKLTLDDICGRINGCREKVYHHLYQMLRVSLIFAQVDMLGRKYFSPNQEFLSQGWKYFSNCDTDLCSQSEARSQDNRILCSEAVAPGRAD